MAAKIDDDFAADAPRRPAAPAQLRLDLVGYEGPLDVMLHLAQTKKLDLSKISVLALAEQYLRFVAVAQAHEFELAGEYLLMAAELVFLKSRLALPQEKEDNEEAEDSAERLRFRLSRLAAFREAAAKLFQRDLLGVNLFARGAAEEIRLIHKTEYQADLSGLLSAYARLSHRRRRQKLNVGRSGEFWPLAQAQAAVSAWLDDETQQNGRGEWLNLTAALAAFAAAETAGCGAARQKRSVLASGFAAGLELARQGKAELRQAQAFGPLYLRAPGKVKAAGERQDSAERL